MTNFISTEARKSAEQELRDAGVGSIFLVVYSHGGASAVQKHSNEKWYYSGYNKGVSVSEILEPINITEVRLVWKDNFHDRY